MANAAERPFDAAFAAAWIRLAGVLFVLIFVRFGFFFHIYILIVAICARKCHHLFIFIQLSTYELIMQISFGQIVETRNLHYIVSCVYCEKHTYICIFYLYFDSYVVQEPGEIYLVCSVLPSIVSSSNNNKIQWKKYRQR